MWIRKLFKIGCSIAIAIPKEVVRKYNLSPEYYAIMEEKDGSIVVKFTKVGEMDVVKVD